MSLRITTRRAAGIAAVTILAFAFLAFGPAGASGADMKKAGKRFDFFVFPGQRHGYGDMNDYWSWIRADYFCKWLLGDFSQTVDLIELQREKEQTGDKKGG